MAMLRVYGVLMIMAVQTLHVISDESSFNMCMRSQICICDRIDEWQECWDEFSELTLTKISSIIKQHERCKDVDSSVISNGVFATFSEIQDIICLTDERIWDICYKQIESDMNEYVNERNQEGTKDSRVECNKMEKARKCITPETTRCSIMGYTECD